MGGVNSKNVLERKREKETETETERERERDREREREKRESDTLLFCVTFNIIISHIFSKNFIEILQVFRIYEHFLLQC